VVQSDKTITLLPEIEAGYNHLVGKKFHVTFGTPQKARSTGDRSQNSCIHGWCAELADQLSLPQEQVYEAIKRMAVGSRGYPTYCNPLDGIETPMPQRFASVEQAQMLLETIKEFADSNRLSLTEYIDGKAVKCVSGVDIRKAK
jgi:hypothetical protein